MSNFDENKHPRNDDGEFVDKDGEQNSNGINEQIEWASKNGKELPLNNDGSLDTVTLQKMYDDRKPTDSDKKDSVPTFGSQEELDALLGEEFKGIKGQAAIDKLLKEKRGHVKGAFHRDDIGDIDIFWGNDTAGLQHIIKQRMKEKSEHVAEIISQLTDTINKGHFDKRNQYGNFEYELTHGDVKFRVIIAPEYHGNKITYVLTAFRRGKKTKH